MEKVWFVGIDVCNLLGLTNPTESLKSLDDDEKLTSELLRAGQRRSVTIISESGLYNLVFRSNKPEAKNFKKWITKEVIPTIRKTGGYNTQQYKSHNFSRRYNDNWDRVDKGYFRIQTVPTRLTNN